jgi:hypothetical protein
MYLLHFSGIKFKCHLSLLDSHILSGQQCQMINQFFIHNNQIKISVVESKGLTQLTQKIATKHCLK